MDMFCKCELSLLVDLSWFWCFAHNILCRFLKVSCLLHLQQVVFWQGITFQSVSVWCHPGPVFSFCEVANSCDLVLLKSLKANFWYHFRSSLVFAYSVVAGPHSPPLPYECCIIQCKSVSWHCLDYFQVPLIVDGKWTAYIPLFVDQFPCPCELYIYKQLAER